MTLYPAGSVFSDSMFQDEIAQALSSKTLGDNRLGEDQRLAEYEYGLDNKANPYSRFAQLGRQQGIAATDALNQSAARGRVRSGAYGIRNQNMIYGQGAQQDVLRSQYDAMRLGFARGREDNENTYNRALYAAGANSLQRKLNEPSPVPPEDVVPASAAADPAIPAALPPKAVGWQKKYTRGNPQTHSGGKPVYLGVNNKYYSSAGSKKIAGTSGGTKKKKGK